jgi:hypothetical protein
LLRITSLTRRYGALSAVLQVKDKWSRLSNSYEKKGPEKEGLNLDR